MMKRIVGILFGVFAYVFFIVTLLYLVGFLSNRFVPKSIDSGLAGALPHAVLVDLLLLALFAFQHSVMARQSFKRQWVRVVPQAIERSAYVLIASLMLALLYWQWVPISRPIWHVGEPTLRLLLNGLFWIGWATVLIATFLINHFELFGLKQVFNAGRTVNVEDTGSMSFRTPGLYKLVRHPIYLGFLIAFWATPDMSMGHLLFSITMSVYILIGIWFEERDLLRTVGSRYREYQNEVRALIPIPKLASLVAKRRMADKHNEK